VIDDYLSGLASSGQIADAISAAVRNGDLTQGAELPSIRNLADTIGVSPGTVALALRTLRERGIVTTAHGRRARIAHRPAIVRPLQLPFPAGTRDLSTSSPDPALLPDIGSFLTPELYAPQLYDTQPVEPALGGIGAALFRADGIDGVLTAVNGALDGMERILESYLRPGDAVLVEDPQWVSSLSLFRVLGLEVVPVAVDEQGMVPDRLRAALASRHCSALVITPRAQNPYGSALSPDRAQELREVLDQAPDLLVLEDDHASLIAGAPAVTLTTGRKSWAVIRSVSKALGPDLRVALMSSDQATADRVQGRLMLGAGWVSHLSQRLVAAVLTDASAMAGVAEAEAIYSARREALSGALEGYGIASTGRSGLNVLIPVDEEAALASYLLSQGWAVRSGEAFRLSSPPFLRVAVSMLPVEQAPQLAAAFAAALRPTDRFRSN
jgi:DNA-binding transcriptional MocR family regulator